MSGQKIDLCLLVVKIKKNNNEQINRLLNSRNTEKNSRKVKQFLKQFYIQYLIAVFIKLILTLEPRFSTLSFLWKLSTDFSTIENTNQFQIQRFALQSSSDILC